jgi:hypothetical protein
MILKLRLLFFDGAHLELDFYLKTLSLLFGYYLTHTVASSRLNGFPPHWFSSPYVILNPGPPQFFYTRPYATIMHAWTCRT